MQSDGDPKVPASRRWIATAAVVILVIAVWKFIDFRMQPPPPPGEAKKVISDR